jgi:hypothetical protein
MPKGRPEGPPELERVCLGDVAEVSVHNRASNNHWALILVAEPASGPQETKLAAFGESGEVAVEGEALRCPLGSASFHRRVPSEQTVDRLFVDAVVIGH